MARWWGAGREEARARARQEMVGRQREVVQRAVEAARCWPASHQQRWKSLQPVSAVSDEVVADLALPLLRSDDPDDVVLGVQLLDPATFAGGVSVERHEELAQVFDALCRPDGDPEVISAALGVWLGESPTAASSLEGLLAHPSPLVRARAGYLYALEATPTPKELSRLIELLDHDNDPGVREQVARGLQWRTWNGPDIYSDPDPLVVSTVVDCLERHRGDDSPAVRAVVFDVLATEASAADLDWLLHELTDLDVHPGFVSAVARCDFGRGTPDGSRIPDDQRARFAAALAHLRSSGWVERVADGDYPGLDERAEALDLAEAAVGR